jgi:Zn-dependent protease/CBS domain-containing protein
MRNKTASIFVHPCERGGQLAQACCQRNENELMKKHEVARANRAESATTQRPAGQYRAGVPLGRWGGVPVTARWSVLFTLALFADVLATSVLPAERPGHATAAYWLVGSVTAAVFLVTVLAHEFGHAIAARHFGMRVKGVTLWMLGGITELDGQAPSPGADALVAVAGPATSIGLGAASAALAWWAGGSGLSGAGLIWLASISVLLGVFNLLPGAPLDGGRLLRALLWWRYHDRARAAYVAARVGRVLGSALIALGFIELIAGSFLGLWLAFVGWFIVGASTAEGKAGQVEALKGVSAGEAMEISPTVLADWWTVEQVLAQLPPDHQTPPVFPLVDFAGQPTGALTRRDLEHVPAVRRVDTRLRDIVRSRPRPLLLKPDDLLTESAPRLYQRGVVAIVVDENNHPVGVLTADHLARAAQSVGRDRRRTAVPLSM